MNWTGLYIQLNFKFIIWRFQWGLHAAAEPLNIYSFKSDSIIKWTICFSIFANCTKWKCWSSLKRIFWLFRCNLLSLNFVKNFHVYSVCLTVCLYHRIFLTDGLNIWFSFTEKLFIVPGNFFNNFLGEFAHGEKYPPKIS